MIEAKELTMCYGDFKAVDKASFAIGKGEIVGLLGPNGAGKTTIMKMLTTYIHPASGTALVGGKDIIEDPLGVRKIIGYLPESLPLYPGMEVRDYLTFVGRARGLSGSDLSERMNWVKERCGLTRMFRRPIAELSKGYKQRTGIAQALIHDPQIVILDEPVNGLDPHQIIEIRNLIEELAEKRTVIISTHILQEMIEVTNRFVIIDRGRIVADGSLNELRDQVMKNGRLSFAVSADAKEVEAELKKISDVKNIEILDTANDVAAFEISFVKDFDLLDKLNKISADKKWKLRKLQDRPFSLEETFLAFTKSEANPAPAPVATSTEQGGE